MTYSGGYGAQPQGPSPQGYGAQGYGQQQPVVAPAAGKGLPFYLNMGVLALGVISFFLGFAPYATLDKSATGGGDEGDSINFFRNGSGVGVIGLALLLAAALIVAFGMLPKQQNNESLVAALSVTGCLSLLFALIGLQHGLKAGMGLILVLVVSFIQAGLAVVVLLFAADVIKPPQPRPQYGGYYGQPGYGAPGYGAQPQQPGYGAQPQAQPPSQPSYQPPPQQSQPPQNPW